MTDTKNNFRSWTPIQVFGISVLFGPAAAGVVSGINFQSMGRPELKLPSILIGIILFLVETILISFLVPREIILSIVILSNVLIALLYLFWQRSCFLKWKSTYWKPDHENETYKSDRLGLLVLSAIGVSVAEILIFFVFIMIFGFEGEKNQVAYPEVYEPDVTAEQSTRLLEEDLINAVVDQDMDAVKRVIEAGADINYQEPDPYGATPLLTACEFYYVDIAKYLVEQGAEVSMKSKEGITPLMFAARASEELFDLLVSKGADMSEKREDGISAFSYSIDGLILERVGPGIAKKLLNNGADVDESSSDGNTRLMTAVLWQRPDVVLFLIENGANVHATTTDGKTPLLIAEEEGDQEMVALLKKHGAK